MAESKRGVAPKTAEMRFDDTPLFTGMVTLDPDLASQAWSRLSVDTSTMQLARLPHTLHRALVDTLKERISLAGRVQRER